MLARIARGRSSTPCWGTEFFWVTNGHFDPLLHLVANVGLSPWRGESDSNQCVLGSLVVWWSPGKQEARVQFLAEAQNFFGLLMVTLTHCYIKFTTLMQDHHKPRSWYASLYIIKSPRETFWFTVSPFFVLFSTRQKQHPKSIVRVFITACQVCADLNIRCVFPFVTYWVVTLFLFMTVRDRWNCDQASITVCPHLVFVWFYWPVVFPFSQTDSFSFQKHRDSSV